MDDIPHLGCSYGWNSIGTVQLRTPKQVLWLLKTVIAWEPKFPAVNKRNESFEILNRSLVVLGHSATVVQRLVLLMALAHVFWCFYTLGLGLML